LGGYDIVITTYETLMSQQKKHNDPAYTDTTLFSFAWHRIVLDEGKVPQIQRQLHLIDLERQLMSFETGQQQLHGPVALFERTDDGQ
jgi:hypothetical protein